MKIKYTYYLLLLVCYSTFGQLNTFDEKIPLNGVTDLWHTVKIPNTVFAKVKDNFSDIRVYGVTPKDTIEAPYVLQLSTAQGIEEEITFELINSSFNKHGYYYSYQVPLNTVINKIKLAFKNTNFDWRVQLEASQDQNKWFTILEDYRILSIQNDKTSYSFSELNFPNSKYKFYRLFIKSDVKPELLKSYLASNKIIPATYETYAEANFKVTENNKHTLITIDLKKRLPISFLKLGVSEEIDYYRNISVDYLADSTATEKGWQYQYRNLFNGTLTSFEENEFKFSSVLSSKLRVKISNDDNAPLNITTAKVKGHKYTLVTRFTDTANYFLAYGKGASYKPNYDLQKAVFTLPENLAPLELGKPEAILKTTTPKKAPLFENTIWLWALMGIIMVVLGGFTLKMIKQK